MVQLALVVAIPSADAGLNGPGGETPGEFDLWKILCYDF